MGISLAGLMIFGVMLTAVMMMGRATLFTSTSVGVSITEAVKLSGERARTGLNIASTTARGYDLSILLDNTGSNPIYDLPGMDVIVQYKDDSGNDVIQHLTHSTATVVTAFADDFDRPDSATVGNGWLETEAGGSEASIATSTLAFTTDDGPNRPIVVHTFPLQSSGLLTWTFQFNWDRTGPESGYAAWMQLGNNSLFSNPSASDNDGVAVNLKWAGPNDGMSNHEGFGYVNASTVTEVAVVSGGPSQSDEHTIRVDADLDTNTFTLIIDGVVEASGVSFDNSVDIDAIRIYADGLSAGNFGTKYIDHLFIGQPPADGGWSVASISPTVYEPGIWNPSETVRLIGWLVPPIQSGTVGTVAVSTPNGVATTSPLP